MRNEPNRAPRTANAEAVDAGYVSGKEAIRSLKIRESLMINSGLFTALMLALAFSLKSMSGA